MTADIDGTLTGHVFADFIHDLRSGQFPLAGITTAGIYETFVLTQYFTGFWRDIHRYSPDRRASPPGIIQFLKT
ncbi:hypothetical protein CSC12_6470 (plasmid) [Klebsiella michiganensis]|nr:hypothetical protein CSC12_6470 [Klebsiella michiganensis]